MKMNKKIISYLLVIVILFNLFIAVDTPKSRAKYVKSENNIVDYDRSFSKLSLNFDQEVQILVRQELH